MSSQTQSCQNTPSSSAALRWFHLDPLHCQIPFSYIKKIVQANYSTFLNVQQWQKNYKKAVSVSHHTSLSLFIIWKGRSSRSDYEPSIPRFNILGSFFWVLAPSHLHSIFTSLKYASENTFINPQIVQGITESLAWAVSLNDFQLFSSSTRISRFLYFSHSSYFHNGNTSILAFSPPSLLKHFYLHLATKLSSSFDFCPAVRQFFIFFECFSHMASQISFL